MNELVLVKSADFNGVTLDCYVEPNQQDTGDFWATRTQIGQLLGYAEPRDAIAKIHQRNKERLDKFSTVVKMATPSRGGQNDYPFGNVQDVTVYSFKGLLEICRYSQQPNANAVIDKLWDIADEIRRTGSYSVHKNASVISKTEIEGIVFFYEYAGLKGNQATLALDKYIKSYTGRSALEIGGIELVSQSNKQLLTPTEIGKKFGLSARRVNELLAGAGFQCKIGDKWEALELGEPYSELLDTNKKHSDGTPVVQLKWRTSIFPIIEQLLEAPA